MSVEAPSSSNLKIKLGTPYGDLTGQHAKEIWHPAEQGEDFLIDFQQSYHPQIRVKGILVQCLRVHSIPFDGGHSL